jgi:hypothetical protein
MRISNWTKMTSPELWEAWKALFQSRAEAEATAIWIANRLVKAHARSTRRVFYEVKDSFIREYQDHLTEGRRVRVERRECRDCLGSGDDGLCERCDGTGIYSERTLYVHYFNISGQLYSFHSYYKPVRLSAEPGEDKEEYGGRFSESEQKDLLLPMSGLLRMLRYVAAAIGFNGGGNRVPVALEEVQESFETPCKVGGPVVLEEDGSHPKNCFCRFTHYHRRRSV